MKTLVTAVAAVAVCLAAGAAAQEPCSRQAVEQALQRVLELKDLGAIYFEDAACDGSIVKQPPDLRYCRPQVAPILQCAEKAAAVLIEHLDDVRPTTATFAGGAHRVHPMVVPLGVVCLDMLLSISTTASVTYDAASGNNDVLGAGVAPRYYFRPDSYTTSNGRLSPLPIVLEVKANWQRALRAGQLKFEFSKWHRGELGQE